MVKKYHTCTVEIASSGFTLIELLVVISVIGILAAGLLLLINPFAQFQKARDAQRKSDLGQIQKALELYSQDTGGNYPVSNASRQICDAGSPPACHPWGS